jgi:hypothetical protein
VEWSGVEWNGVAKEKQEPHLGCENLEYEQIISIFFVWKSVADALVRCKVSSYNKNILLIAF